MGFRPFVYRLADRFHILGWVRNTSWGVEIEALADGDSLDGFVRAISDEAPPLARIEHIDVEDIPAFDAVRFEILHSEPQAGAYQLISPDIATCPDCLRELTDPDDRRYRYPFTNCTNCGPRFTIISDVPYDRPLTTMRGFCMCPACQREYDDPLDRRFHAQPNACPVCGPHVSLVDNRGNVLAERDEAMRETAARLLAGHIIAIKGLGGYQLACDATNDEAVSRLRERKRRPHKPLAIMTPTLEMADRLVHIHPTERELLLSSQAPIVLLNRRAATDTGPWLAAGLAPGVHTIGIMLPYTPLHHVLLADVDRPLVMTSGNLAEEPIVGENDEALSRLGGIADELLLHNRGIYSRYDDSVWFVPEGGPQPVRRARGYAPSPIRLGYATRPILACGPEMKNTFCLTRDEYAFLSQHVGDMENVETLEHYQRTLHLYRQLFHIEPEIVAVDMHPEYRASRLGRDLPGEHVEVQHHHAHLVSCLAENQTEGPAIGVILDGTGYGLDGRIWGGEVLVGDAGGFERAAHLEYLPLPGGDVAIKRPYRLAYAYSRALLGQGMFPEVLAAVPESERQTIQTMVARGLNTPLTSSMGRLFDAVSALLGVCREASYDAQPAIELEAVAGDIDLGLVAPYAYGLSDSDSAECWGTVPGRLSSTTVMQIGPLFRDILADATAGVPVEVISARFHESIAQMVTDVCWRLRSCIDMDRVVLSGGCFQNRLLLARVRALLMQDGFEVITHKLVPCNDGGVALGQAVIAHHAMNGG